MARRRKKQSSGWAVVGLAILLGCLLGPVIMTFCLIIATFKALKHTD